jgi:hypothetical protein
MDQKKEKKEGSKTAQCEGYCVVWGVFSEFSQSFLIK